MVANVRGSAYRYRIPATSYHYAYNNELNAPAPKMLIFFFIGIILFVLFSVCCCVCCCSRRRQRGENANTGNSTQDVQVDEKSLSPLSVFVYSTVEQEKIECVVCLGEFKDGEKGRVLPGCKHRFHARCIDKWFTAHSTCPICRANVGNDSMELPV